MSLPKRLWTLAVIAMIFNFSNIKTLFPVPSVADEEELSSDEDEFSEEDEQNRFFNDAQIEQVKRLNELTEHSINLRFKINDIALTSDDALRRSLDAIEKANKAVAELDITDQARANLILERHAQERAERIEDKRLLIPERIGEEMRQGVHIAAEQEKWKKIREILNDSKPLIKVGCATTCIALFYYIIKHGIPILMHNFTQPKVISETSKRGWFSWGKPGPAVNINDLVFAPVLQKQLTDLLLRMQTAKQYNEGLPNVLFFGATGTGKTAFAKALAAESGLDYALTSGSEFTKITDLSVANDEFRKLLSWAKNAPRGLIVFIDEAESLFINRAFSTTSKISQDFINTFLALISDQSQKNVMFILSTNHPFKLDDSIVSRIGINVEFTLPGEVEREEILAQYIVKFAQENDDAIVEIHPEITKKLSEYAQDLEGFSPRAIKFVAEDMIIKARRQGARLLSNDIALLALSQAKQNLQQDRLRKKEREEWLRDVA